MSSEIEWNSNQSDHDEYESCSDHDASSSCLSNVDDELDRRALQHPKLKIHCDSATSDEQQQTDSYDVQISTQHIARLTKHVVIPSLWLIFAVSIAQIMLINFNFTTSIHHNEIILLYIWNNSTTFNLAFAVSVTLTMIGSVLSLYAERRWQPVLRYLASTQRAKCREAEVLRSNITEQKRTINTYKSQIKHGMHKLHKVYYDNHKLEAMANSLLAYKKQVIEAQIKYEQKTKRKIFRQYIKDIDKQYQDIQEIMNENQLVILSIILSQLRISKKKYVSLQDYYKYERLLNVNTRKELSLRGGFKAVDEQQQRSACMELTEFEHLIETVIDVIEENQCTFVNY